MAKIEDVICQTYNYTTDGDLTPTTTANSFALQIRHSKHFGRPKYLQMKINGNARPLFVSSLFEPRTDEGIFNIEINKRRYEATRTEAGIKIQPLPYRQKIAARKAKLAATGQSPLNNNRTFVANFATR